ncbi:HAD domain-containing protein (plasmid) [Arthrobacter sp. G.S.26]|uniref:HAD domain-containing protein n=1 Tax=Arthrobacter sp. G.S.26 TaxID=3433706 RepID=UPI003D770743
MNPVILLDVDGVLNPLARPDRGGDRPTLKLSDAKATLVRRLASCGRIAWVSTWPADLTNGLEAQLQLEVDPLRVTLTVRGSDDDEPTPKLRSVTRWLARMESSGDADWDSVVWIDDVLGPDARAWADGYSKPVLLEKPLWNEGLTEAHVIKVEMFGDNGSEPECKVANEMRGPSSSMLGESRRRTL